MKRYFKYINKRTDKVDYIGLVDYREGLQRCVYSIYDNTVNSSNPWVIWTNRSLITERKQCRYHNVEIINKTEVEKFLFVNNL